MRGCVTNLTSFNLRGVYKWDNPYFKSQFYKIELNLNSHYKKISKIRFSNRIILVPGIPTSQVPLIYIQDTKG